ncbi:hypothetical protein TNCV_176871 [Trichonephila clavipes]|nr:hypothetical protein TNCV_176871 [Trichonephila clavipes]
MQEKNNSTRQYERNNSTRQHERNNSTGENNSSQQEKATQLCTAVDRLQPPAPPLQQNRLFLPTSVRKQFNSPPQLENQSQCRRKTTQLGNMNETSQQEKTTQRSSRNETTQQEKPTHLSSRRKQLNSSLPSTAYNRLHRLYSRIGFLYLLTTSPNISSDWQGRTQASSRIRHPRNHHYAGVNNIIDSDFDDEKEMNYAAAAPTSSEMRNILKKIARRVGASSFAVPGKERRLKKKNFDFDQNLEREKKPSVEETRRHFSETSFNLCRGILQRTIDKYSACVEVGKPIDENPACVEVGTNSV